MMIKTNACFWLFFQSELISFGFFLIIFYIRILKQDTFRFNLIKDSLPNSGL